MKIIRRLGPAAVFAALVACGGSGETQADSRQLSSQTAGEETIPENAGRLVDPQAVNEQNLKKAVSDERVRQFYEDRNWTPAWTKDNAPALVEVLHDAGRHGLNPRDYVAPVENAGDAAAREAALTRAAIELADALGDGKADPGELFSIYTLPRPNFEPVSGLGEALAEDGAAQWIQGLAPADEEYNALSEAYLKYAERAAREESNSIGSGELIREGDTDPRVSQIRQVLRSNGYLANDTSPSGSDASDDHERYTEQLAQAVENMQRDFGIAEDGIVGPETLKVLNTGAGERARLLAVNLERRRWLERKAPSTRIDVNTASAKLDYFRNGELSDSRKVVVGQPGWETPQLGSPIYRLVANPTWTVPRSIEEEEIEPRGPGYLERNNMVRRDGWVVQLPGPDNALGLVKFDMQNKHAIYLHDTPAKQLFSRNQRHLSHGCIRVENAPQFARMLARTAGVAAEFNKARASGSETFVDLPQNIPVRLLYHTAFVEPSGGLRFRTDAYGWDDRVAEALGYEARQSPTVKSHMSDIGP